MMKNRFRLLFVLLSLAAATAQAQTAPPYTTTISPTGAKRGTTVTFTIDGYNLGGATDVLWSKPGITSKIVLNSELVREPRRRPTNPADQVILDKATKNLLTVEATIAPDAAPGFFSYRIVTPLGTTNLGRIAVGVLPETKERESMSTNSGETEASAAQKISLPTTVIGDVQTRGDADQFRFAARAGQQIVFEVIASMLGSKLDSVLALFDEAGRELAANNDYNGGRDSLLTYTFKQDGEYVVRLSDRERGGQRGQYVYRLNIGEFPYLTHAFPLGVKAGATSEVSIHGFNLESNKASVAAPNKGGWDASTALAAKTTRGESLNTLKLAAGAYPEVMESATPSTLAAPQSVAIPATINGRIFNSNEDFHRFRARKGQRLVIETGAQRYGSPLDSVIEVLDAKGNPIPRVLARCILETQLTLNDRDSATRGFRLLSWNGIHVNDFLLAGNELVQIDVLPKGPDEDTFFKNFRGERIAFEDTTPETHAVNSTAYKVTLHPPGTKLAPNGLPVVTIYYRNDDGPPVYGKDSKLNFTAPEDGEYIVRIRDVRAMQGERFAYRLSIHEPAPDFVLFADPENPNIPQGSTLPINVTAYRHDGFDGDIAVKLVDLPAGFTATEGVIRAGQNTTVITISAPAQAGRPFPLRLEGAGIVNGKPITRELKTEDRIAVVSVGPAPELLVWTDPPQVVLEPGGQAWVSIRIERKQGFAERVPFDVRNLPLGVIVTDVGLNGVMITPGETTQRFSLRAESWAKPQEQPVFVVGHIETTSPRRYDFPAKPFTLVIQAKQANAMKTEQKD
jgi:hypothetical protein